MRFSRCLPRRALAKLASPTLVLSLLLLTGCGKTEHMVQLPGNKGTSLGNGEYLFPNAKGELRAGKLKSKHPPAGTLITVPVTNQEVIDSLKSAGAKFEKPSKVIFDTEAIDGVDVDKDGNPIPQETKVK